MWWTERSRSSSLAAFPDAGLGGSAFYRCPIDLFLRHEHPRSGNENLVTIVETLRAFGHAYGIQREDEDR